MNDVNVRKQGSRAALASLVLTVASAQAAAPERPAYRDPFLSVDARVDDLLARMTLEEKVGQMNMPCVYEDRLGEGVPAKTEAYRRFAAGTYEPGIGPGGGFFTLPNTILHEGPRQQALFLNELQEIARKTRLGIPLLETEEGTYGLMCSGGTIFPEGLALGSTFDHRSCRFFSHDGQNDLPRQEKATSTLLRHSEHHSRAMPCSSNPQRRNSRSTRSTTARSGPCCRMKRLGQSRSSSSRWPSTSRNSGESRGRRGL